MKRLLIWMGLAGMLHGCAAAPVAPASSPSSVDFMPKLLAIARETAAHPYIAPDPSLPAGLSKLTYDQYRQFAFRPEKAIWRDRGAPFELQLFSRGWLFKQAVAMNTLAADGAIRELNYSPDYFVNYRDEKLRLPDPLGFAGWRAHFPLNNPAYKDEAVVFLGASYFRALSRGQAYGSSVRSLAIDTATDHEQFPILTRFYLLEPAPGARSLEVYAILDSAPVVGAYRYVIEPGETTVITVEANLIARREVAKLCVAPITSMFLHGKRSDRVFPDFRPEVHDADLLLIHDEAGKDRWAARPLNNPRQLRTIDHPVQSLRGFGLLQRERDFHCYQDLEAAYDRRPGVWIEPIGRWGPGRVELFELSSDVEYNDNINAYFIPDQPLKAGESRGFRYRIHWLAQEPPATRLARVAGAWRQPMKQSADGREGKWLSAVRYLIDFAGPELAKMTPDKPPQLWVDAPKAKVLGARAEPNPHIGGWRLVFEVDPLDQMTVDLRAGFAWNDAPVSETWIERWSR